MTILGAGAMGLELGQAFCNLGVCVHIVDKTKDLFPKEEPEVSDIMKKVLLEDGINFYLNSEIIEVSKKNDQIVTSIITNNNRIELESEMILVALGRIANTENIGLENVNINKDKRGFISVNSKLQTTQNNIYACGDVRGKYLFTNSAAYDASVIVRNALIAPFKKINYASISWVTYTVPEVAHVGKNEKQVKEQGIKYKSYTVPIHDNDRSKTEDDRDGFVKIIIDNKSVVIGATIVAKKAGEMLPLLSLLVAKKMKLSSVLSIIYPYPIQGEIIMRIALMHMRDSAKPWQMKLLKTIVKI